MKRILVLLLTFHPLLFCQQGHLIQNPIRELPRWVRTAFAAQKLDTRYLLTLRRYPHILKGDFNADSRRDIAIQVTEKTGGQEGIVIFHGTRPQLEGVHTVIIGAGKPSDEFPEDLRSFPRWSLLTNNAIARGVVVKRLPAERKGDVIQLETADSTGGFIYWDGRKYQWRAFGK
jgi:hypothetical protein